MQKPADGILSLKKKKRRIMRKEKPNKRFEIIGMITIAFIILSSAILLTLQFSELTGFTVYEINPPDEQAAEQPLFSLPEEP